MAYYTERHTMREPVKKTYDISVDVYTLIFQCCEKYYNNLAWKYPDQCPDGYGCCGLDLEKLNLDLKYEIPTLFRDDSARIGIPSIHSNIFSNDDFINHDAKIVIPMLARLKKCRDLVKLGTANELDLLDHPEYRQLQVFFDSLPEETASQL